MSAVVDLAARELISHAGLDQTLFVEAGAGTGKTTQLVERVVNLVVTSGVRLTEIAAITFTEAAASELQDRIRVRFEQEAARTDDDQVRQRCRQAVDDSDLAAISTLHGFAKRILAEHPVAVGLPPRVEILDEVTSQLAYEARWERFVDQLYGDPAHEELLVRAALLDVALEVRYRGQATMKDVAATLTQSWDRLGAVAARTHPPLPALDLGPLRDAVEHLEALTGSCTDPDDKLYVKARDELLPAMRAITGMDDPRRALRALAKLPRPWTVGRLGRGPAWSGDVEEVREAVRAADRARSAIVDTIAADVLHRLLTLVSGEVLAAARTRQAEGRLEFHDLLVLARELLRTSPEARRVLHHRYRRLLLDEFQDTDPIQIELAVLIAATVNGDVPDGWRNADVEQGRLFFVGDPKQSIYRFRRADISLFLEARDRFAPDGTWQRLTTNFRTVAPVVGWNNALFGQLMAAEVPGAQPRYETLVAHRQPSSGEDHRPVLLGAGHPKDDKVNADRMRQFEAADVARAIADIRQHPARWPVEDPDAGGWRPARLPDITILVPTRTSLPFLREALQEQDIPYRLDTGTLVYSTQEVRDVLAVLHAVDDPSDSLALVAALRSPLYACADTDLFTWRANGGRWDLRETGPEALGPRHPVAEALAHLRSLWDQRWWSTPSDLLDRLLTERRAFLLAFGSERPNEVWRRLRFLLDQARAFDDAGGGDLRAFLEWAGLQGNEGSRVHEPLLPETDDHAVRVMTVHGAKGLEFPITILSGMTTRPANRRSGPSVVWDDDGFPQVRFRKGAATELHDPRADIEAEMDEYEKLRLLYVAATRARDHLLVSCHHTEGDRSYANIVWQGCQPNPETWRHLPDRPPSPAVPHQASLPLPPSVQHDRESWVRARQELLEAQRQPTVLSATAIARLASPTDEPAGLGPAEDDDPILVEADGGGTRDVLVVRRRGRAGSAIGRAVHATLQVLDLADPHDVDGQAARQAELEAVPEAAATVAAMVRSALDSAAVGAAVAAPAGHHKEVYVAAPVGTRVIEGYVDLLIDGPDGLVVVDYKTDTVGSEREVDDKLATYELQGGAYAVALEVSTGRRVVDCRFVFCRPGGAIERSVGDLASVKDQVRRLVGEAPTGSSLGVEDRSQRPAAQG